MNAAVSEVREESYTALATKTDLELLRHEVINKVGIMLIALGVFTITSFAGCLAFFIQYIKH